MKKILIFASLFAVVAFGAITASAQCSATITSPIQCGYFNEGFQDGTTDTRNNQRSDYKRYRNKYENKYENFYRDGYNAGYDSARPTNRWTNSQRNAYDSGYSIGQDDRRNRNQNRSAQNISGGYDQNIGVYFQQGYYDGFNNLPRKYDVILTQNPTPPGGSNSTGTATWSGRVDGTANIIIQGSTIRSQDMSGGGVQVSTQYINGVLPRRNATISFRKTDGRGTVRVFQQPNRSNNYTAIIQIEDPRGGADNYALDISWFAAANVEERYQPGSVTWRGRVDHTARIIINGNSVQTEEIGGSGVSGVSFNLTGYLANRPGTITVNRRDGRGQVRIIQQPNWDNDFTAIVEIFDDDGGADNYRIDINW